MKQITTILLTILALGCNAQEPTTHTSYSVEYGDSLKMVILDKDIIILDQDRVIDSLINASKTLNPLMLADTFNYFIVGITDSLSISVEKLGGHVKIGLKNGEKIVLYIDY